MLPPSSEKTLLDELKRVLAFPILKVTVPLGEPAEPVLTAEKLVVVDGQNQSEYKEEVQFGSRLDEGDVKNRPFEPVSRKLEYVVPLKVVVNSAYWSEEYAVTEEGMLFARVPIPSMSEPVVDVAPPVETLASCTITPLLSSESSATGFCT